MLVSRINEFNVDQLMALILPFHETPQFAQMLQILKLDNNDKFTALQSVKKSLQPLPRQHFLTAMVKSHSLLLWTANLLKPYTAEGMLHPALVSFWTASLVGYIDRMSTITENQMLILLPVIVDGLKAASSSSNDVRMAACLVLSRMAPKVEFNDEAMEILVNALLSRRAVLEPAGEAEGGVDATIATLVILCESQRSTLPKLPKKALSSILRNTELLDAIVTVSSSHSAAKLLTTLFAALVDVVDTDERASSALVSILSPASCPAQITAAALPLLIDAVAKPGTASSTAVQALNLISQRDSEAYYSACEVSQKGKSAEEKAAIRRAMAAVSGVRLHSALSMCEGLD